jgi:hypothetical protein
LPEVCGSLHPVERCGAGEGLLLLGRRRRGGVGEGWRPKDGGDGRPRLAGAWGHRVLLRRRGGTLLLGRWRGVGDGWRRWCWRS